MRPLTLKEQKRLKEIQGEMERQALIIEENTAAEAAFIASNRTYFFRPWRWQHRLMSMIRKMNTTIAALPNKLGKTTAGVNIVVSWALGFEPWNEVGEDHPGAVLYQKKHYAPSSLGIAPPVKIRISGEEWKYHIGQTIIPELKKWAPRGEYETRKNEQGVEYLWHWRNGSSFEVLSHTQEFDVSESWTGHGWWPDEPPPKPMYNAMSRGIFLNHGKILMTHTPLKDAWVLDELILSGRRDVGVINDLTILDNEELYEDEIARLKRLGLGDSQIATYFDLLLYEDKEHEVFVQDKGKKAIAFVEGIAPASEYDKLSELKLLRFVQDTDPSLSATRFGGKFKSLIGRVLKPLDVNKHFVEPFPIPTDWPMVAMIDFHLNKPQAIAYHTVSRQNVKFINKEIWEHLSPEETADAIIRDKTANAWNLEEAYIDPLSKGDTAYMRNRMGDDLQDSFSIIEERLAQHGITLFVASKDKDSGIRNINTALTGVNGTPTYFVFNTCARHLHEALRWIFGDDGKPEKSNDDMMENWYRATLTGLVYRERIPHTYGPGLPSNATNEAWMGV